MRRTSIPVSTAGVVLAIVLVLPACSLVQDAEPNGDPAPSTPSSTVQPTPSPEAAPVRTVGGQYLLGRWPLTGEPARGKAPLRPVVVVKVDNTSSSSPQVGLSAAELIVQQMVEGGQTRLAAFYYRRLPPVVGPVRSLRATDIPLVRSVDGAVVAASGGAPPTIRRFDRAKIKIRTESASGFFRQSGRSAPYDLMVGMPGLQTSLQRRRSVPSNYLPWGNRDLRGPKARRISAAFSSARSSVWQYRKGLYEPLTGYQPAGDRFVPETLVVLRVPLTDAGYRDPGGNPVPETPLIGRGQAIVFHGGRLRRSIWVKRSPRAPLTLVNRAGRSLTVPAGRTWVELVPTTGGSVSWSRR